MKKVYVLVRKDLENELEVLGVFSDEGRAKAAGRLAARRRDEPDPFASAASLPYGLSYAIEDHTLDALWEDLHP